MKKIYARFQFLAKNVSVLSMLLFATSSDVMASHVPAPKSSYTFSSLGTGAKNLYNAAGGKLSKMTGYNSKAGKPKTQDLDNNQSNVGGAGANVDASSSAPTQQEGGWNFTTAANKAGKMLSDATQNTQFSIAKITGYQSDINNPVNRNMNFNPVRRKYSDVTGRKWDVLTDDQLSNVSYKTKTPWNFESAQKTMDPRNIGDITLRGVGNTIAATPGAVVRTAVAPLRVGVGVAQDITMAGVNTWNAGVRAGTSAASNAAEFVKGGGIGRNITKVLDASPSGMYKSLTGTGRKPSNSAIDANKVITPAVDNVGTETGTGTPASSPTTTQAGVAASANLPPAPTYPAPAVPTGAPTRVAQPASANTDRPTDAGSSTTAQQTVDNWNSGSQVNTQYGTPWK